MKRVPMLIVAVALLAATAPAGAQCRECQGKYNCELVDRSWAATCIFDNQGCVDWGVCVILIQQMEDELSLAPDAMTVVQTPVGALPMAWLPDGTVAAWGCTGGLMWVGVVDEGALRWVDLDPYASTHSFAQVRRRWGHGVREPA